MNPRIRCVSLNRLPWIAIIACWCLPHGVQCFLQLLPQRAPFMSSITWKNKHLFANVPTSLSDSYSDLESSSSSSWRRDAQNTISRYFDITYNPLAYHPEDIRALFHNETVEYIDTAFYNMPLKDPHSICRHLQLLASSSTFRHVVDESVFSFFPQQQPYSIKALVLHRKEPMVNSQAMTVFHLHWLKDPSSSSSSHRCIISKVFTVTEPPAPKPGSLGLYILKGASFVLNTMSSKSSDSIMDTTVTEDTPLHSSVSQTSSAARIVHTYFQAWNQRQMQEAIQCFTSNVTYYDLQYSHPIRGIHPLEQHLHTVADCLPRGFRFCIDDFIVDEDNQQKQQQQGDDHCDNPNHESLTKVGVQWHVENNRQELPFTRGCSFYKLQSQDDSYKIQRGIDIPEPAVWKAGLVQSIISQIRQEPIRILPLAVWIAYMYIVFFSNGILPGANALSFETRTWEEVRDLSLNFFLVAPILDLSFSPTVHPMLEGIFNVLLAWAAMFVGFLSDDSDDKPNRFSFGIMVVGMQFLTSAFLLPYLGIRTSEVAHLTTASDSSYSRKMNTGVESIEKNQESSSSSFLMRLAEWKPLGLVLSSIGSGAIFWSFWGRPEFGSISERYESLQQLLSIDRVGCSFLVDLVIFSLFQGWLIDDDLRRRGIVDLNTMHTPLQTSAVIGKFIPFYGLAYYFWTRPQLCNGLNVQDSNIPDL